VGGAPAGPYAVVGRLPVPGGTPTGKAPSAYPGTDRGHRGQPVGRSAGAMGLVRYAGRLLRDSER